MVIDPAPGFRADLTAAIEVLAPQIDGFEDLALASISSEAKEIVSSALADRTRRRKLILNVIAALDEVAHGGMSSRTTATQQRQRLLSYPRCSMS